MPDEQFAACAGYDALTYVKFLQLCLRLTFWVTIIVGITVLPTNWAAGTFIDQQLNLQDDVEAKLKAKNASWTIAVCDVEIDAEDAAAVAALVCIHRPLNMLACRVLRAHYQILPV